MKKMSLFDKFIFALAGLTALSALVGGLYVGFSPDYSTTDFQKGLEQAYDNYRQPRFAAWPVTSALGASKDGFVKFSLGGQGTYLELDSRVPKAVLPFYATGDIFPFVFLHLLVLSMLCFFVDGARVLYVRGLQPRVWSWCRGKDEVHDKSTMSETHAELFDAFNAARAERERVMDDPNSTPEEKQRMIDRSLDAMNALAVGAIAHLEQRS